MTVHLLMAAAGESRRYREEGITKPKALLRVDWMGETRPMVEHARIAISGAFGNFLTAIPEADAGVYHSMVVDSPSHVFTVKAMLAHVRPEDAVVVADCDVLLAARYALALVSRLQICDVAVAVGAAAGPGFSSADSTPWASRFYEAAGGDVPLPVVGLRGFRRAGDLLWALREGARTMTEAVNMLRPPYATVLVDHWTDWGTPAALRASGAEIAEKQS